MSNENEFGKYEAHIDSIINQYRNRNMTNKLRVGKY